MDWPRSLRAWLKPLRVKLRPLWEAWTSLGGTSKYKPNLPLLSCSVCGTPPCITDHTILYQLHCLHFGEEGDPRKKWENPRKREERMCGKNLTETVDQKKDQIYQWLSSPINYQFISGLHICQNCHQRHMLCNELRIQGSLDLERRNRRPRCAISLSLTVHLSIGRLQLIKMHFRATHKQFWSCLSLSHILRNHSSNWEATARLQNRPLRFCVNSWNAERKWNLPRWI